MYSDSEDDAPEEFTFEESKAKNKKSRLAQTAGQKSAKQKRKQKNKEREELFSEQKKAKIAKLAASRLPDEILETLPDDDMEEDSLSEASKLHTVSAKRTEFSSDDEQDEVESGIHSTITSKISVKEVEAIKAKAFSAAVQFKSFKQSGVNTNIKRQTARERELINEKKRAFRRIH